jgi:hypothetical protein
MKRVSLVALTVLALAGLVSAQQMTKDEAQKKVNEAKKASCEIVKKQVAGRAAQCPEEAAAAAKVDCAAIASYKTDDMMKLNQDCMDKVKGAYGKAGTKSGSSGAKAKADEPKAAAASKADTTGGKTHKCRAMEKDEVVAEAEGDGVSACYAALKEKLKELKCGPLTKKYPFTGQYLRTGKTEWSEGADLIVFCSK